MNTLSRERLLGLLRNWLSTVHDGAQVSASDTTFPEDFYVTPHFLPSEESPTHFLLAETEPGWFTVYFNSFAQLEDLARDASELLDCTAIVVQAQSVSEAYFLLVFRAGQHLRTLYWAGDAGEWVKQDGEPLPFETQPLGTNIARSPDDEPFFVFEREDAKAYCENLGLHIWSDSEVPTWLSLEVEESKRRVPDQTAFEPARARWWHFWRS